MWNKSYEQTHENIHKYSIYLIDNVYLNDIIRTALYKPRTDFAEKIISYFHGSHAVFEKVSKWSQILIL